MSDFVINTPNHKRWILPDNLHYYNSFIYGDTEHISIIRIHDLSGVFSVNLKLGSNWEEMSQLAQELANKRFPKQLRHKSSERQESAITAGFIKRDMR